MKKLLILITVIVISFLCVAWYALEAEQTNPHTWYRLESNDHSLAKVNQVQGVFIFIQSTPVAEYSYQGTIKSGVTWSGKPDEIFNSVVKSAHKKFPDCDGIIFTDASLEKADCIKFK